MTTALEHELVYTVQRTGATWQVVTPSGMVQFSSLARANCRLWVRNNGPKPDAKPEDALHEHEN
jgi:hypothetical protein